MKRNKWIEFFVLIILIDATQHIMWDGEKWCTLCDSNVMIIETIKVVLNDEINLCKWE